MGKKSYAQVKQMMNLGRYPTRAELFKECYYKENGSRPTSKTIRDAIEQLKELEEQESQVSNDAHCDPTPDDLFAKVLGKDKHGYVRMYGTGVKPADINGTIPSRGASYRLAVVVPGRPQIIGESNAHQSVPFASPSNPRSSSSMSRPAHIRVHSNVVLKSLGNINKIVASGYVSQMGYVRVNGEELGLEWCEIIIQYAVQKDVRLLKPYDHIQTIGDSIGAPVAWPLSLVTLDEDGY